MIAGPSRTNIATPANSLADLDEYKLALHPSQRYMLRALRQQHPVHLTRWEMMSAGGFDERTEPGASARFEWHILRLEDALRPHGWRIGDHNFLYRLIKI